MRVILDTNVLISGLLMSQGASAKLLNAWERKLFTLVACDELIYELRDVASRPFFKSRLRASAAEVLAAGLHDFTFYCADLPAGPTAPDPKDSYLLSLAEVSEAEFLVTGDKALQALKKHKGTRIVSPARMIDILLERSESDAL